MSRQKQNNTKNQELMLFRLDSQDKKLDALQASLDGLKNSIEDKYVSVARYRPVEMICYGLVAVLMTALLLGIVTLVVKGPPPLK